MKYANCCDEIKIKNITTELSNDVSPGDRIIYTKDWGRFRVRKNGRRILEIGNEIIRVTPMDNIVIK